MPVVAVRPLALARRVQARTGRASGWRAAGSVRASCTISNRLARRAAAHLPAEAAHPVARPRQARARLLEGGGGGAARRGPRGSSRRRSSGRCGRRSSWRARGSGRRCGASRRPRRRGRSSRCRAPRTGSPAACRSGRRGRRWCRRRGCGATIGSRERGSSASPTRSGSSAASGRSSASSARRASSFSRSRPPRPHAGLRSLPWRTQVVGHQAPGVAGGAPQHQVEVALGLRWVVTRGGRLQSRWPWRAAMPYRAGHLELPVGEHSRGRRVGGAGPVRAGGELSPEAPR